MYYIRVQMTGYLPVLASHCKEGVENAKRREAGLDLDGHDDDSHGRLGSGVSASRLS